MCICKTIYTEYTYQYTWKVTDQDFILSILQLKALLKNLLFHRYFSRKFQFLRNPFVRKLFEWLFLMAMTKYCNLDIKNKRGVGYQTV